MINGAKILLKALSLRLAEIVTEDNKLDAAKILAAAAGKSEVIRIRVLQTKYPQGDEAPLILALSGRETAGRSALDMGFAVFSAFECAAIFYAFSTGMPVLDRIVTVDGDCIANPKNLLVSLGSPVSDVIQSCGGLVKEPEAIIAGGPMRGKAIESPDAPVTQNMPALLALSAKALDRVKRISQCIRCGRCVEVCPVDLRPYIIAGYAQKGQTEKAKVSRAEHCTECGACSYICPAGVRITELIKKAKEDIKKSGEVM